VTWLHDRYELGIEGRLPRCWAQHPGLVEELWALKAWREEIYEASQPSGQAARYWHAELRQVIQAATSFYAAGCRTGHRGATSLAAEDAPLQQRWAAASPVTGIPAAALGADLEKQQPGRWLSPIAMAEALDAGRAKPLSTALPDYIWCADAWWRASADGWARITDTGLTARLNSWATQMAQADAQATRKAAMSAAPAGGADHHAGEPIPGYRTTAQPT
jgi:hypothetical protein